MQNKEGGGGLQHRTVLLDSPKDVEPYVHQVMPNQSPEEFAALKADIREVGIEDPIWLDKNWAIVDGHHRTRAWIELLAEGVDVSPVAANVYESDDPEMIYERAMKRNLNRRQLNNEQKAELVRNHLKHIAEVVYRDVLHNGEAVSWPTNRIASFLGFSRELVRRIRFEAEASGDIPRASYLEGEDGRVFSRDTLLTNLSSLSSGDVARSFSIVTPDGEVLEGASFEELQAKVQVHMEGLEEERQKREKEIKAKAEKEYKDELEQLQFAHGREREHLYRRLEKDVSDWLETWRNPDEAPTIPNIPVEVWEEAIKRAKSNRTEKVEQVALSAGMNASELKEYEPEEVIEFVLQSDWRDLEIDQYKFAADWYRHAVEAIERRLERPVWAMK